MKARRLLPTLSVLAVPIILAVGNAHAELYPTRPVKLVVPYAAGGAMDVAARLVAKDLGLAIGEPVIVENISGAAGTVGAAYVAHQAPDGYTLCYCATGVMTITPLIDKRTPYKPLTDLVAISHVQNMDNVLMARSDLPADDLKGVIALSKRTKGGLNYGTPGEGGTHHLGGEMLKRQTGMDIHHVPYRGEAPAIQDLMGKSIDLVLGTAAAAAPLVKEGRIKIIASLGPQRSSLLPNVPTIAESGFPDYGWVNFVGLNAPAHTDPAIVDKLSKATMKVMRTPALRDRFTAMGFEAVGSTPTAYAALLRKQTDMWAAVLQYTAVQR